MDSIADADAHGVADKKEIIIYLFINTVAFIPESKAFLKSCKKNGRFSDSFHVFAAFPFCRLAKTVALRYAKHCGGIYSSGHCPRISRDSLTPFFNGENTIICLYKTAHV